MGGTTLNSEKPIELLHEFCYKLGAPIRYYLLRQSVMFPYVTEIELSGSSSRQSSDCAYKMAPFGNRVNYHHNGILPIGLWQLHYKVQYPKVHPELGVGVILWMGVGEWTSCGGTYHRWIRTCLYT